jgi:hypothetical protein
MSRVESHRACYFDYDKISQEGRLDSLKTFYSFIEYVSFPALSRHFLQNHLHLSIVDRNWRAYLKWGVKNVHVRTLRAKRVRNVSDLLHDVVRAWNETQDYCPYLA